jgi:hypothetical protein
MATCCAAAGSWGALPVWSNAPVRRACSDDSARVLTQCPCPFSVRMSLPCCGNNANYVVGTALASCGMWVQQHVRMPTGDWLPLISCRACPHLRVPHVDGGVLRRGVQQPVAAPPHAAHRQRVAGHAEQALQRHLGGHPHGSVCDKDKPGYRASLCWQQLLSPTGRVAKWAALVARRTASHTRSVLSCEPLTKRRAGSARCAGSHATDVTHFVWPCNKAVSASLQNVTLRVKPQVSARSTQHTQPSSTRSSPSESVYDGLTRHVPLSLPLSACQTRICPSMLPLTRYFASGDHATHSTQFL